MTPDEFHRVRTYQRVISAWSILSEVMNGEGAPDALEAPYQAIRTWLANELESFERLLSEDEK
jgi:hypothetical protein